MNICKWIKLKDKSENYISAKTRRGKTRRLSGTSQDTIQEEIKFSRQGMGAR